MNTATYRGIARNAEAKCEWHKAAVNWERAIAKYPGNLNSALAKLDIGKMQARADACHRTAAEEAARS